MITLYSAATPNGMKANIAAEEAGVTYTLRPIRLREREQKEPWFVAISPQGKIPALVDSDGPGGREVAVFESGAVMVYLADRVGSPIWPNDPVARSETLAWLLFQGAHIGPTYSKLGHFRFQAEAEPGAIATFEQEAKRVTDVVEARLSRSEFFASTGFTIADIAHFPWLRGVQSRGLIDFSSRPAIQAWIDRVAARPAVQRGLRLCS